MSSRKKIEKNDWQDRLQSLTSGNRGRDAMISNKGKELVTHKAFASVIYDPVDKGNDIMISVDGFAHTVTAPAELYIEEHDNGSLASIEVVDKHHKSTFLRLI